MIRMFFTYMLPLALPTLIYVLWVWNARRKHDPDGEDTLPAVSYTHPEPTRPY